MGKLFSKESNNDLALLEAVNKKKNESAEQEIPRLEPYEVNPAIANMATAFVGGGPQPQDLIKGLEHKRRHSANFVCKCRSTGQEAAWHFMKPVQAQRWVENGDLLVSEAERIIRDHKITAPTGELRLQKVYKILESKGL